MANDLNVVYKISADITGLKDGVDRAAKSAEGLEAAAGRIQTAMAGAFTVTALVGFGKALIDDADALVKMSDRTGASIQGLQKLQVAGDDAGNTIEQMTQAINQMQNRLASGDSSAISGLEKLGLSVEHLRDLKPDQAFIEISDAIRQLPDPTDQTRIAMELFGKSGAEILPTLKRGFDDLKGSIVGMSDETVRALDAAGDTLSRWARIGKGYAAEFLVAAVEAMTPFQTALNNQAKAADDAAKHLQDLGKETAKEIKAAEDYAVAITSGVGPQKDASIEARTYADLLRKQEEAQKKSQDALDKAREALKKWNDIVDESTIKMNLSVFTLNRYGAVTLPAVTSALQDVRDQWEGWLEPLNGVAVGVQLTATQLEGLQRAGQFATVAMDELNKQLLKLPNVHSSLEGVDTTIHHSADGLTELAQAFGTLAQVSDGAFKGALQDIGRVVAGLELAKKAMENLSNKTADWATQLSSAVTIIGLAVQYGPQIAQLFADLLPGKSALSDVQAQLDANTEKIRAYYQAIKDAADAAAQAQRDLDAAMHAGGARSNTELQKAADLAREAFEKALKSGDYNQENLDKLYVAYQQALADAGSEAAKEWLKAHNAINAGAKDVDAALQKLIDRRDELTKSISQEAPEAVMGVIEQQQRAERDALDQQIENAKTAADAQTGAQKDASGETTKYWDATSTAIRDALSQAGDDAAGHIQDAFDFTIHIPIVFDTPDLPVVPMATGGIGTVTHPTLFLAGEAGPEQYAFSGANRTLDSAGGAGGPITVQVMLDGQVVAENTVTRMARDKRGIGTKTKRALGIA